MKKNIRLIVFAALATACTHVNTVAQTAALPRQDVKAAIAESNDLYFQAFVKGDSSLFIDRYANDACIMPPNTPAMCGKNAAPSFYQAAYQQMGIRNGQFITKEIFGKGDYVTEQGIFELRDAHNRLLDNGKYLVLWKKTPKGWKMYRDSFSSDNPVAAVK